MMWRTCVAVACVVWTRRSSPTRTRCERQRDDDVGDTVHHRIFLSPSTEMASADQFDVDWNC